MKSWNIFLKMYIFLVTLCSTYEFGILASITFLPFDGKNNYAISGYVDWNCISNATCTTPQSFCNEDKKCQCPLDYVFNAAMTDCLEVATAYGEKCTDTAQCVTYLSAGGICTNGICSCAMGYHYLHGRCNKSSGLGEKCQNDDDCNVNGDFEALSCTNNVCRCSDGFYQREYRTCRREAKAIGEECAIDLDCRFDKKARCNKTSGCYVESEIVSNITNELTNVVSLSPRKSRAADSNLFSESRCSSNEDCSHFGPSVCTGTGRCICKRGYGFDSKKTNCIPELGEKCQLDSNVTISHSICRNGRWSCEASKVPSRNNLLCRKATTKFRTSCQFDEQCYIFGPDSLCANKTCICNENSHYIENEMFCWINRRLGETCQMDEDCHVEKFGSKLTCNSEFKCGCPIGTHLNWAKKACIDDLPVIGGPCSNDIDCKPLDNSQCLNESCKCIDGYFDLSDVCISGINAACKDDLDCNTNNSTCHSKTCRCAVGLVSPSPDLCVPVSPFGSECQYDIQCSTIVNNALCFKRAEPDESTIITSARSNGTCKCDTDYHYRYKRCYKTKVLGETCDSQGECYVTSDTNSVRCLKGVCTCNFNATQINSTFCENDGSIKYVFSSWLILTILIVIDLA